MTIRQRLYREYLKTPHWKSLRHSVLVRDGFKCVRCDARKKLQAHHRIYRTNFEDSVLEDLVTLCKRCHKQEHGISSRQPAKKKKTSPSVRLQAPDKALTRGDQVAFLDAAELMLSKYQTLGKSLRKQISRIANDKYFYENHLRATAIQHRNTEIKHHAFQPAANPEQCVCGRWRGAH